MLTGITKTIYENNLSDVVINLPTITRQQAENIFTFFKNHPLFRWGDANNDCEDRANAICMLLDAWHIPNFKSWVFAGTFLRRPQGSLVNYWNYHVAAAVPVTENGQTYFYAIDPATTEVPEHVMEWADNVTQFAWSYYVIKSGNVYIFDNGIIYKDNWHKRDRRNYNWTMQGLAGINGVAKTGQAALAFQKKRVMHAAKSFTKLLNQKPVF